MKKALIIILVLLALIGLIAGLLYFFWTPENFAALGDRFMEQNRFGYAEKCYTVAVGLDSSNEEYALLLVDANLATGNYTHAERSLVNAIRKEPDAALYRKLSEIYVAQDKLLDAQQLLDGITDDTIRAELDAQRPATPVFSDESGEYEDYLAVSVTSDGTVYYSLDEQYPSTAGNVFSEPLSLPAGVTHITAIAVGENGLVSTLAEAEYQVVGVVEEVTFSDGAFGAYIREMLYKAGSTPVMTDELWSITELTMPEDAADYTDLAYFPNLLSLTARDSRVEDYSVLTSLPLLEKLDLSGSLISAQTLEYIGTLTALKELDLSGCGLSNILPLAGNTALTTLDLSDNSISNIGVLSNYAELSVADLSCNALDSIDALSDLTQLTQLNLSENNISSIQPLSGCTQMSVLNITSNRVTALDAARNMPELTQLLASGNQLSTIAPLANCMKLERLELANNRLTEVNGIKTMLELTYIDISHNAVETLPTLSESARIQQFYASYNALEDISMLAVLQELNYVDVDYNEEVEDITCLSVCSLLVQVDAFGTKVEEVKVLTDMGVIVNYSPVPVEEDGEDSE